MIKLTDLEILKVREILEEILENTQDPEEYVMLRNIVLKMKNRRVERRRRIIYLELRENFELSIREAKQVLKRTFDRWV